MTRVLFAAFLAVLVGVPQAASAQTDVASLSPRERADRLFNRVISAAERGDRDTTRMFAPMALLAYSMLPKMDPDAHLHRGLLYLVQSQLDSALWEARQIEAIVPEHLFGSYLRVRVFKAVGDRDKTARAYSDFVSRWEREQARARPEYEHHREVLQETYRIGSRMAATPPTTASTGPVGRAGAPTSTNVGGVPARPTAPPVAAPSGRAAPLGDAARPGLPNGYVLLVVNELPATYRKHEVPDVVLERADRSAELQRQLKIHYSVNRQPNEIRTCAGPAWFAMARTGGGGWGWSCRSESRQAAEDEAMASCRKSNPNDCALNYSLFIDLAPGQPTFLDQWSIAPGKHISLIVPRDGSQGMYGCCHAQFTAREVMRHSTWTSTKVRPETSAPTASRPTPSSTPPPPPQAVAATRQMGVLVVFYPARPMLAPWQDMMLEWSDRMPELESQQKQTVAKWNASRGPGQPAYTATCIGELWFAMTYSEGANELQGAKGWSCGYTTRAEAERVAMGNCEKQNMGPCKLYISALAALKPGANAFLDEFKVGFDGIVGYSYTGRKEGGTYQCCHATYAAREVIRGQ